ncbi:MAG: hypothetical protein EZS28_033428 [Streblomastix strix]|uniref:Uncharacterized protein n=1 Tax=Streblomastix strix TaxID=222440 RepID=A0A5J4UMR0_9EUKA|nr:MAG: hypothetical protein EZS28_033428 [Streblomastix strix]
MQLYCFEIDLHKNHDYVLIETGGGTYDCGKACSWNVNDGKTVIHKLINAIIRRRAVICNILVALEVLVRDGGEGIRRLFTNAFLSDIIYDELPNAPTQLIRLITCDDRILNKTTTESVQFLICDDDLPN